MGVAREGFLRGTYGQWRLQGQTDSSKVLSGFHEPPQLCSMSIGLSTTAITTTTTPCPTPVAKPKREPCVVAAEYVFASSV